MDRRERFEDPVEATRAAMDGRLAEVWTALPGIVQDYDAQAQTVSVQPTIKGRITRPDGSIVSVALPLLVDVPVQFPNGGGFSLTFPIKPGDEALVAFASRCIDGWWQSGGVQDPLEPRMHDLSDGFAFVGPRSRARALSGVSTEHVQLRTDDGATYIEIQPGGRVRIDCEHLEEHARTSRSWDVDGYGQRITSLGGGAYHVHTWQEGAVITTESEAINPPEGPSEGGE
ncbi:MAG: Gp138 family membrane-puncturing spike protein [Desulfovibrionaceae bacterium]